MLGDDYRDIHAPNINVVTISDGVVASLFGRIDIAFAPALRQHLLSLVETQDLRKISIDLSQITHIDSSGIATLIEVLKIARTNNVALKLQGMNPRLLRLLEVTGILPLFNGHDDKMRHPGYKAV